jgi:hypothetical protein
MVVEKKTLMMKLDAPICRESLVTFFIILKIEVKNLLRNVFD